MAIGAASSLISRDQRQMIVLDQNGIAQSQAVCSAAS